MFQLRCTVRNCGRPLASKDRGLSCDANHHFDRAKEGYWSLIQPQDRKSANPGDSDDAVLARKRWLELGLMNGMVEVLRDWTNPRPDFRTLDLGCGEGSFGRALFASAADGFCGIDLSKRAVRLASRAWPDATWVHANADRTLPVMDQSVDQVMSLFGRRPVAEIARVLKPGGRCVVAVPGEEDLIQLREQVQDTGVKRSRWKAIAEEMSEKNLTLESQITWTHQAVLPPDVIRDALTMTYRAVRRSQNEKLENVSATDVTLAADLMLFTRESCYD